MSPSSICSRIKNDRIRIFRTTNLFLSFFCLGMTMSIPGPTLPDLEKNIGGNTSEMGFVLGAKFAGYFIGSALAGFLFGRFNRQFLFFLSLMGISLTNAAIPFQTNLFLLIFFMAICGMFSAILDTGSNVYCLDLWPSYPGTFMQALHFCYAFGSVICPLIAEPFLSPDDKEHTNSTNGTLTSMLTTKIYPNVTEVLPPKVTETSYLELTTTLSPEGTRTEGRVEIAYLIISSFVAFVAISVIISFFIDRSEVKSNTEKQRDSDTVPGTVLPRCLIGFTMMFLAVYASLENSYSQFLATFVIKSRLQMSKSDGSFMTSVFWLTFCIVRGCSIYGATRVKPLHMLFFNMTVMSISAVMLAIWGGSSSALMWACSALLGLGSASAYPSGIAWAETYVGISNAVSALFLLSTSSSSFLMALLVGYLMNLDPHSFQYVIFVLMVVWMSAFLAQLRIVSLIKRKRAVDPATSNRQNLDIREHFN